MTTAYGRSRTYKRPLLPVMLVVAGALAIGWFMMMRTETPVDNEPARVTLPSPVATSGTKISDETVSTPRPSAPVETSKVFASKDPFEPLVEANAAGAVTDDTGELVGASDHEASRSTHRAPPASQERDDTATTVAVVDVSGTDAVDVTVEGKAFRVTRGDTFAKSFKLLYVDGKCASMLYGDDQFHICEGERLSK